MALVVVSKPSGIQPIGTGELNYVFSQASIPGAGYHIEIELNGLSTPKFYFYPDSSGVITCNIATILRANLAMSFTTTERFKNTYVKYQEVWDAGSNAQVPLSSDVIYFYIGSNNILNKRSSFVLTSSGGYLLSDRIFSLYNRNTYIELLHDASLAISSYPFVSFGSDKAYLAVGSGFDGTAIGIFSTAFKLSDFTDSDSLLNDKIGMLTISSFNLATSTSWSSSSDFTYPTSSYPDIAQKFTTPASTGRALITVACFRVGKPSNSIKFSIMGDSAGLPNEADIKVTTTVRDLTIINSTVSLITIDLTGFSLSASTVYHFVINSNSDGICDSQNNITFWSSNVSTYAGGNLELKSASVWSAFVLRDLRGTFSYGSQPYKTIPIYFKTECANPIYLKWLNDYGGISTYLFDYNQIFNIIPNEADGRYKKMIVFAQSVSIETWKMLEELNRNGAEYGDNQKLGAYVVDFTDESNPVNIYVEPNPSSTLTKNKGNNFQIVLRYPLIDNILI